MDESNQQLLQTLKSVVEGLLNCQVANVWNIYGGLSRLHNVLEKILKHEFLIFKQNGEEDCWIFIQGLNWLQPSLATSPTPVSVNSPPPHPHTDKAMIWLHNSLETHSLSEKLAWLVSDEQHLASCYSLRAFLRHPKYVEAALVCLRAIEQNQLPLLAEIHPCLYLSARSLKAQEKFHRRCSSFPESFQRTMWTSKSTDVKKMTEMSDLKNQVQSGIKILDSEITEEQNNSTAKTKIFYKIKPWRSLPDVANLQFIVNIPKETVESSLRKSKTEPSSPAKHDLKKLTPSMLKVDYMGVLKENNFSIKANRSGKLKMSDVNMSSVDSIDSTSLKRRKKKSFIEDGGGNSIEPMTSGSSFPKPEEGQSLINFLSSELFTQLNAELDRETSHFRICEAVISAIEQVKCNNWEKMMEEKSKKTHYSRKKNLENEDLSDKNKTADKNKESDEEKDLTQRIRLRKRLKDDKIFPSFSDTTNTDQSFSPRSSDSASSVDSVSTDVEDHEVDKVTNLSEINNSGLSLSLASLYSEADLVGRNQKSIPSSSPRDTTSISTLGKSPSSLSSFSILEMPKEKRNTAELVGLSLLSKFDDQQLPKASDIQWVLSDLDVPEQKLLPLPHNFHVEESFENLIALRGTETWAPPRAQLVLTCQTPPKKSVQITKQEFRCAGCGMKVAPEYSHRFRYCEYLTKYFCTGCHKNKQMLIPGRIVFKWDFKKYPVSDFSFNVLEHMMHDPLFNVNDLNPELYKRVKNLEKLRKLRMQLPELKKFLEHCKYYSQEIEELNKLNGHLITDCDTYSIIDFIQVKTGELLRKINQIVTQAINHVGNCPLCRGRGFMCEMCSLKDVIYPWQIGKVCRCSKCGSCHHTTCLRSAVSCPRCIRLKNRGRQFS